MNDLKPNINYQNLVKFDWESHLGTVMEEKAKKVLIWAEQALSRETFPRSDYREMVELMIIYLGGVVDGFTFHKLKKISPARFLQRGIMYIIMRLLCDHYEIFSKEEDTEIKRMSEFSALYFGIWFLTCPLTASAPYNDLNAIKEMRDLKDLRQVEADACLDS